MSHDRSSTANRALLITLISIGTVGLVVLLVGLFVSPPPTAAEIEAVRQSGMEPESDLTEEVSDDTSVVYVYRPFMDGDDIAFQAELESVPPGVDSRIFALNRFLRSHPAVPDAAIVTACTIESGVANVTFTPDIVAGYGSEDEGILVRGIVRTMAQWPEVQMVRFLRNGDRIDTFGNIDLSVPIPVASERDQSEMVP